MTGCQAWMMMHPRPWRGGSPERWKHCKALRISAEPPVSVGGADECVLGDMQPCVPYQECAKVLDDTIQYLYQKEQ